MLIYELRQIRILQKLKLRQKVFQICCPLQVRRRRPQLLQY